MRATTLARPGCEWEGALDGKAGAADVERRERFLRVADAELDRSYRLAGLLLGSAADAEDATQEALLRAWSSLASLRDPATFRQWFDRILVNVCRDRLRRRSRVRFLSLDAGVGATVADPFRDLLARDEALRALASLEVDERTVLILHFWADLTLADVALHTGWPIGTVKSRLHRGLRLVAARLAAASEAER